MKEKRKVSITIDDLDDTKIVFEAIDNLFRTLICHYIDTDFDKLNLFVVSMSVYFGKLLGLLGYREEEFEEEK
jgi:hypothetical protein